MKKRRTGTLRRTPRRPPRRTPRSFPRRKGGVARHFSSTGFCYRFSCLLIPLSLLFPLIGPLLLSPLLAFLQSSSTLSCAPLSLACAIPTTTSNPALPLRCHHYLLVIDSKTPPFHPHASRRRGGRRAYMINID